MSTVVSDRSRLFGYYRRPPARDATASNMSAENTGVSKTSVSSSYHCGSETFRLRQMSTRPRECADAQTRRISFTVRCSIKYKNCQYCFARFCLFVWPKRIPCII
jgi:hypothetical protein